MAEVTPTPESASQGSPIPGMHPKVHETLIKHYSPEIIEKQRGKYGTHEDFLKAAEEEAKRIDAIKTEERVRANATLSDEGRKQAAEKLIGPLTEEQGEALRRMHEVGKDRPGAGVYNYNQAEISEKARIGQEVFTKKQRRTLMESGLVGILPNPFKRQNNPTNTSGQPQEETPENTLPEASTDNLFADLEPGSTGEGTPAEAGGGQTPERPRGPRPPEMSDEEWETSPERGRWLVDEIVRLRTKFAYEERYKVPDPDNEGRPYLERLYKDLQDYVDTACRDRHAKDPWNQQEAYKKIQEAQKDNPEVVNLGPDGKPPEAQNDQSESQERSAQSHTVALSTDSEIQRQDKEYLSSKSPEEHRQILAQLIALYERDANGDALIDDIPVDRLPDIQKQLLIYFRQAKEEGLLQGADDILTSIYQEHIQPGDLQANQAVGLVRQALAEAIEDSKDFWRSNRSKSPVIDRLKGIWKPYAEWARARLHSAIHGLDHPEAREGEFRFIQETLAEGRETYWRPGSWTGYYIITAKTPEQFRIAADSFLQMIRTGAIGKSPEEVYKHLQNFKEQLGSQGAVEVKAQKKSKQIEGEKLNADFMKNLRLEFEALSYIFGADYSNESYNTKSYKQFMEAMALHEGPDRWVRLYRARDGMVAAFTDMFDHSRLMEIYNNPVGERGELDIIAQHFIQDQIKEKVIERGMGIRLKDYDPGDTDPKSPVKLTKSQKADKERAKCFRANLERLGIHISKKEFKALYEGLDEGDAHTKNSQLFGSHDRNQLPEGLRRSVELGEIQEKVSKLKRKTINKLKDEIEVEFDQLTNSEQQIWKTLTKAELERWKAAYDLSAANFDVAFQMQGATGEKVRKGKGFFYVDRNPHIQAYLGTLEGDDSSKKIGRILTQVREGGKLDIFSWGVKSQKEVVPVADLERINLEIRNGRINQLSENDRDLYSKALADFKTNLEGLGIRYTDQIFQEVFNNLYTGLDANVHVANYKRFKDIFEKDKTGFNKLPHRLKMSIDYGRIQQIIKDNKLDQLNKRERKIYDTAQDQQFYKGLRKEDRACFVDNIPVYLVEDLVQVAENRTKILYANTSAEVRAAKVDKVRADTIRQVKEKGWEAEIVLPGIKFDTEGNVIGLDPDEAKKEHWGLETATKSIYARYTTHTYWGYQGENRHMLLAPHIFEAAKRIRSGESDPDKEDMLATQLLIVDPTLNRVARFDTDQQNREFTLLQAAVEASNQDRQRIRRELYAAFLSKSGQRGKMRLGYNMEDWGGKLRFAMGIRELVASQPARFARRLGAEIANIPMEIDSMSAIWGGDGMSGAIEMFADQIKRMTHQGVVGQFGITKFIDQMDYGSDLFDALIGSVDSQGKIHVEGLLMKPTNDNEKIHEFYGKADDITKYPDKQIPFMYEFKKCFGRLEKVMKLMRVMYSDVRNAGGALDLEKIDIFLENGEFNQDIDELKDIANNTGTSRHSEKIFFDGFVKWLLSSERGGGGEAYPNERYWNSFLNVGRVYYLGKDILPTGSTIGDWLFDKLGL